MASPLCVTSGVVVKPACYIFLDILYHISQFFYNCEFHDQIDIRKLLLHEKEQSHSLHQYGFSLVCITT